MSDLFSSESPVTLAQARTVAAGYQNVFIENLQPAGHFQIVIRDHCDHDSQLVWRNWNYESGANDALNSYLQSHGLKAS
ncbi:TPA: DUF905 family protein [Salmonella enterica]